MEYSTRHAIDLPRYSATPPAADHVCCGCGGSASGETGLPVYNGQIVPVDWHGEWGGVPCCEDCFNRHAAGEMNWQPTK